VTVERRTPVALPSDLAISFVATADARKHQLSTLLYGWFRDAVLLVIAGKGDLLPQKPGRRAKAKPMQRIFFKQGKGEFDQWTALLEGAGSSLSAVETAAVSAYVDAGGDQLAMSWPPFRAGAMSAA
jgi:hypothetical protein